MKETASTKTAALIAFMLVLPALHPLFRPLVGAPSHLLWFVHVLAAGTAAYRFGRSGALPLFLASPILIVAGERLFGWGYGVPADWQTVIALAVSAGLLNFLMIWFGLYARRMTHRYQMLFDRVTLGVIRTDARDRIVASNPQAQRILGRGAHELEGCDIAEVLPRNAPSLKALEEAGGWTGRIRTGGERDPGLIDVVLAVIHQDDPLGHQILIVDRSMEVLQEREIQRQSKLATLGEALAGVAHEFKNPLQVIAGYAELGAMREQPAGKTQKDFATIKEQADRMRDMVQDLLGYSRPSAGAETARVDPAALVGKIVSMQRIALGKRVRLTEQIEWNGTLCASANRIEQILLNFISNSADALEGGGGRINVRLYASDDRLNIEISDNGPGIDPDFFARLFQPFATTKPEGKGTGLGLAISQRFARSMDGQIVAQNRPEGGASFTLHLPLAVSSDGTGVPLDCEEPSLEEPAGVSTAPQV